jgi:hypothetical protein
MIRFSVIVKAKQTGKIKETTTHHGYPAASIVKHLTPEHG